MALLSLLWGLIYLYTGAVTAGAIPLLYAALSFISIGYYALTGRYHLFRFTQLLVTLLFPAALMLVLGGFVNSSGVILWSLTSPVGAMLFAGRRQATGWFLAFAVEAESVDGSPRRVVTGHQGAPDYSSPPQPRSFPPVLLRG